MLLHNSDFFRASLSGPWRGGEKSVIKVVVEDPLADLGAIEAVLQGLYAHRVDINESEVLGLIAASSFLGVPRVYNECRRFMEREIDLMNVSRFCNFAATSEYPVSEAVVKRCVKYLTMRAYDDARELLPELPVCVLKRLFLSPGLWVPSETDKFELIVETFLAKRAAEELGGTGQQAEKGGGQDLMLLFRGQEVRFGAHSNITIALKEVLCNGIQYMHMKDWDYIRLRKQLRVNFNPCLTSVLERHSYNQKVRR